MDLEKAYDRVNREFLWKMLRMQDEGGKLLNSIKSIYVNSLDCVGVKFCNPCFKIDSGVRQGCVISPWLSKMYMDTLMNKVKMGMRKRKWKIA